MRSADIIHAINRGSVDVRRGAESLFSQAEDMVGWLGWWVGWLLGFGGHSQRVQRAWERKVVAAVSKMALKGELRAGSDGNFKILDRPAAGAGGPAGRVSHSCLIACNFPRGKMADDSKKPSRWQERKAQRASMYATTTENAAILQARRKKRGGRQYVHVFLCSFATHHWNSLTAPFLFICAQRARRFKH